MFAPKHKALNDNLLSNSKSKNLSKAAEEWQFVRRRYTDKATSCEFCGSHIKNVIWIRNKLTSSEVCVGEMCWENIQLLQNGVPFQSPKEQEFGQEWWRLKVVSCYTDFLEFDELDYSSWRIWFLKLLALKKLPLLVSDGAVHLKCLGIVEDEELLQALIAYHDDHRKFLAGSLLQFDVLRRLGISNSDLITLNEARKHLKKKRKRPRKTEVRCSQCYRKFSTEKGMNEHCRAEHPANKRVFRCSQCNRKFSTAGGLDQHCKAKHVAWWLGFR